MPEGLININGGSVQTLEILFLTTMIALLPSLLVMMTSFTRYVISFSFLRSAMGTQQTPPNIVLIGLAVILTYYTMGPAFARIKTEAYDPYVEEEIDQVEFLERAAVPLKEFMLDNTKWNTLGMFCELAGVDTPADRPGRRNCLCGSLRRPLSPANWAGPLKSACCSISPLC